MSRPHRRARWALVVAAALLLAAVAVVGLPIGRGTPSGPAPEPGSPQRLASLLECLADAEVTGLSSADPADVIVAQVRRQQPGDSAGARCLAAHPDVVPPR